MVNPTPLSPIAYNSDLIIQSHSELAALGIFYDRIFLASTSSTSCGDMIDFQISLLEESERPRVSLQSALEVKYVGESGDTESTLSDVPKWDQHHAALFEEAVLQRLAPVPRNDAAMIELLVDDARDLPTVLFDGPNMQRTIDVSGYQCWRLRQDLVAHMLRNDLEVPAVFNLRDRAPQREFLKALQVRELFNYFLPATTSLPDQEILEMQRKVSDTREGFGMHLQQLSAGRGAQGR